MNKNISRALLASVVSMSLTTSIAVKAETGVSGDAILFGQSAAMDGPAAALGNGMNEGIMAAFAEANRNGGVGGRQLQLNAYDDGYEPERAIEQTNKLIQQDQVFALIGGVGTPTSKAAQPIATEANVPYIGPFTGAGFLRNPELTNVVNVRGTYDQETETWIKHLTEDLGYDRIAILYQDDSFGRVGLSGCRRHWKSAASRWQPRALTSATPRRSSLPCSPSARQIPRPSSWSAPTSRSPSSSSWPAR